MRKFVVGGVVAVIACLGAPAALAAGQPNASCEAAGANPPPGFSSGGFAHAEQVYAGSEGTPSAANGSPKAVSQYDIACFGGPRR
jgi:hypothetical protein